MKESELGGEAATVDMTLAPYSSIIRFDDLTIYRVGGGACALTNSQAIYINLSYRIIVETMAPSSALPIGSAPIISETKPVKIDPSQPGSGLLNSLLAILTPIPEKQALSAIVEDEKEKPSTGAGAVSDEDILARDVAGFVVVYVCLFTSWVQPSFTDLVCINIAALSVDPLPLPGHLIYIPPYVNYEYLLLHAVPRAYSTRLTRTQ